MIRAFGWTVIIYVLAYLVTRLVSGTAVLPLFWLAAALLTLAVARWRDYPVRGRWPALALGPFGTLWLLWRRP